MQRVVVFLDYRNVYHGARRAFFTGQASKRLGHVNALALGQLIASRGPQVSDLTDYSEGEPPPLTQ